MHALFRIFLALALALAFVPITAGQSISTARADNSGSVTDWSVVKNGSDYVFSIKGTPYFGGSEYYWAANIGLTYEVYSGYQDQTYPQTANITATGSNATNGATSQSYPINVQKNSVSMTATFSIPQSALLPGNAAADKGFTISFLDKAIAADQIPDGPATGFSLDEPPAAPSANTPSGGDQTLPSATYNGIAIDGSFDDWAALEKVNVSGENWGPVSQVAMVWDGDWVYIYLMTNDGEEHANWNSVTYTGSHYNGRFCITTDLGETTMVQPTSINRTTPGVSGPDNAKVAVNDTTEWSSGPHLWEIAVPTSELGHYNKTISFGLYETDIFAISNVANIHPVSQGPDPNFSGITYDGKYDDWSYYEKQLIEYAGPGTQEKVPDGQAALFVDGDTLFSYCETQMPAHIDEKGGQFTGNVNIRVNGSDDKRVMFRYVTVDGAGNINWNPQLNDLPAGTYEYYVFPVSCWATSTNINNLNEHDICFGRMTMTVNSEKQQMESELSTAALAQYFDMSAQDMKTFSGMWGRIGPEWVTTAGTSTGPVVLLAICGGIAVFGAYLASQRRASRRRFQPAR